MADEIGMTQYDAAHNGHQFATKIRGHQPVVGSDGEPVGTVDAVEGDNIKLTRNDPAAGGRHHYIPLTAVANVDHSVRLGHPAAAIHQMWREDGSGDRETLR